MLKYKFNLKDISLADFKLYLGAMFKAVLPKSKLRNLDDLKKFIQLIKKTNLIKGNVFGRPLLECEKKSRKNARRRY